MCSLYINRLGTYINVESFESQQYNRSRYDKPFPPFVLVHFLNMNCSAFLFSSNKVSYHFLVIPRWFTQSENS